MSPWLFSLFNLDFTLYTSLIRFQLNFQHPFIYLLPIRCFLLIQIPKTLIISFQLLDPHCQGQLIYPFKEDFKQQISPPYPHYRLLSFHLLHHISIRNRYAFSKGPQKILRCFGHEG